MSSIYMVKMREDDNGGGVIFGQILTDVICEWSVTTLQYNHTHTKFQDNRAIYEGVFFLPKNRHSS